MNQLAHPDAARSGKARFTVGEFTQMMMAGAFADMKVELIEGELERMNPPMSGHGNRQMIVGIKLWQALGEDSSRVTGEVSIRLDETTVVACDAAVLHAPIEGNRLLSPRDMLLVVEIAETTLDRDTGIKRRKYAEAGIAHYWVVDGQREVVHVYGEPIDGDYADIATVRFGAPLAVPGTDATITL